MSEELSPALVIPYPRKRFVRGALRTAIKGALALLTDMEVIGGDNLPEGGPPYYCWQSFQLHRSRCGHRNHPMASGIPIRFTASECSTHRPLDTKTLRRAPRAPRLGLPIRAAECRISALPGRGCGDLSGRRQLGNCSSSRPPGSSLPCRAYPGPHPPIGIDGVWDIFPHLRRGKRARVTIRIGKPFGPFKITGRAESAGSSWMKLAIP